MRFRRRTHMVALAMVVVLVAAACGGGDDSDGATEPAASESADSAESTTSTSSTTTAPVPEGGASLDGIQLSAVVFGGDGHVTLTNTSDADVTLDGLWLCNRPAYFALSGTLAPGESVDVSAGGLGGLSADGGEAGLYTDSGFGSSDSIIDYVSWGSGGGRGGVAADAGLWPEGVNVSPTGDLIELSGAPGDPEAWS